MIDWYPTWPGDRPKRVKTIPLPDSKLTTIVEISDRINSIDRQVAKKESIKFPKDWDKYNNAVIKLNRRKDALWIHRAKLIKKQ